LGVLEVREAMDEVDEWLTKYDNVVAYLMLGNRRAGTLFLEVQDWTFVEGPILRRRKRHERKL